MCVWPWAGYADGTHQWNGEVTFQPRVFWQDAAHAGQKDGTNFSFSAQPEYRYQSENSKDRVTFIPFARYDSDDQERTHFDVRQAYYLHVGDGYEMRVGADRVFWGVAESNHLVDFINQTDLVEDPDTEDKFGQPMVNLTLTPAWGTLNFYYMPYFRERSFAGQEGRLRGAKLVDVDNPRYERSAKEWAPDFAARYSHYFGDWDLGVSYFHGTSRDPGLIDLGDRLQPFYQLVDQLSADVQYTTGSWLWKLESLGRWGQNNARGVNEDYAAFVGGFEYTSYQIFESDADLGYVVEWSFDDRGNRATSTLENDVFVGMRWTANDVDDSAVLFGVFQDLDSASRLLSLEAETRLTPHWTIALQAMMNFNPQSFEAIYGQRRDDHLLIDLTYHF